MRCSLDGVTALRVLAGDSDDFFAVAVSGPAVVVDLGPGSDDFDGHAPTLTVTAGDGSDRVGFTGNAGSLDLGPGEDSGQVGLLKRFAGPLTVEGGEGRDSIDVTGVRKPGVMLSGGEGDDEIHAENTGTAGVDVGCGPGDDLTVLSLVDRAGDGCAAQLARGTFDAPAGPLRVRLKTTDTGRRWIRRDPDTPLFVTVELRTGGDTNQVYFDARLKE